MSELKKCSSCVRLPQPVEVFINKNGKECKMCFKCREKANTRKLNNKETNGYKYCSNCARGLQPIENFINANNRECKLCCHCRNKSNKQMAKPETRLRINEWKNNNIERVKLNVRKNSKLWLKKQLETNREAFKNKLNNRRRLSISGKVIAMKTNAVKRGIPWGITDEQASSYIIEPCTYCNYLELDKALNGIDRLDSKKGYSLDNCVACCTHCNLMKGCYDPLTFIRRCKMIGECTFSFPDVEICDKYRTLKNKTSV